jgi:hypothetical protein
MSFGRRESNDRARMPVAVEPARRPPRRLSPLQRRLLQEGLAISGMLVVLGLVHLARLWSAETGGVPLQRLDRTEVYLLAICMVVPWYVFRIMLGLPAYGERDPT